MSLLPSLLLTLLALFGGAPPDTASMTSTVWHRAQVSQDQLAAANKSESYQVLDEILCSILATNNPWCHLFIHEDNTCVLYDVLVDSLAAPPPEDTVTLCMLRNECIVDGIVYPHGDTLYHLGLNTTCWNRDIFRTYPVSSTCDAPFSQENIGCVHLLKEAKNWTDARQYCENLEADLAVVPSESFSALQAYISSNIDRSSCAKLYAFNNWNGWICRLWEGYNTEVQREGGSTLLAATPSAGSQGGVLWTYNNRN